MSGRAERLVRSMAEDICFNVTPGQWKMPKHLLLGMTVRHLTGSFQVINILNRFGHCASHSTLLELETAMCDSVNECSTNLPSDALEHPKLTHFCWDNFDLIEETADGSGTTHSTHGITIQEIKEVNMERKIDQPSTVSKTKKWSATFKPYEVQPCFSTVRAEPPFAVQVTAVANNEERQLHQENFLWVFCRMKMNTSRDLFPGWKGWLLSIAPNSQDKNHPIKSSVVEYMPLVNAPITEAATVQKVLQISLEASQDLNQPYTFVTFDLAVAKKAYEIVWQNPHNYKTVIIHLGVFHTIMSYLGALGKLVTGSGFEEIVTEARLCAHGSIDGVVN
ncbi:hypothetical protein ElyMa_005417700 [Elysia marginata]|uniref:Uncharacterized protein n=1 Tax=Elysia marginata TaxID=1093978 RepID=A0AAV4EIU2_9GAST|nr:hypothetical protein ElyMa_005417700 [Elysia marginata]